MGVACMFNFANKSPIEMLQLAWQKASQIPFGDKVFSRVFGRIVPYTGSISPEVIELRAGYAEVRMLDRRPVRNHLKSVHAMALANLGEAATGLALNFALPATHRSILRKFEIEYLKKSRGTLTAVCEVPLPLPNIENADVSVDGHIFNEKKELVATVKALWRVGPLS